MVHNEKMAHIHHAQILVQNGNKYLQKFTRNANFQLFATRTTPTLKQWAVRSGSIVFVITELAEGSCAPRAENSPEQQKSGHLDPGAASSDVNCSSEIPDQCFLEPPEVFGAKHLDGCSRKDHEKSRDTVFNVAFKVDNVEETLTRAEVNRAKVLCRPTVVKDPINEGHVIIAAVQSCVGNVVHTLVNSSSYSGAFLPGFVATEDNFVFDDQLKNRSSKADNMRQDKNQLPAFLLSHIDHVTFACPMGSSSDVLQWYERCFGMKRFLLTREEHESDGFVVQGRNVGLRMKAMEYWHCAESGLALPANPEKWEDGRRPRPPKAKFVIAETLPGKGPNQVETFLAQHGGAGIQHIGLHTDNILHAVSCLRQAGLSFIEPPAAYYTEVGKLAEILRIRNDVELLKKMGILLDEESPHPHNNNKMTDEDENEKQLITDREIQTKYLMQVFTKPLFERDTFFLEIIQRCGATGFGAGNIRALWRAVQSYMSYDDL